MMANPTQRAAVQAYVLLLVCDLILWLTLLAGLLWFKGIFILSLSWIWAFRAVSCFLLNEVGAKLVQKEVQPLLKRWIVLLCFLPPVFDTIQTLGPGGTCGFSPVPDVGMVVLSAAAATVVYMVWEMAFPSNDSKKDAKKEKKEQEAKALLMRVIRYSKPDYPHLGAAFIFLILAALLESFIPYYVGEIIDVLKGDYQHNNFLWAIGLMSLYSFGSSLFGGLRGGMFMCSLSRLNRRIRHMLFQNLMKLEISFFEDNKPGSLTSRLVSDTDKMGRSIAMNVNVLLRSLVKTCSMLVSMLCLSWQLTILTCVEMPLLAVLQNNYNTLAQKTSRDLQDCKAEIEQLAFSAIDSMKTVRSFRAEAQEQKRYEEALARKLQIQTRKGIYSAVHLLLRRFVSFSLKIAMLIFGQNLISSGQLSSGGLLAFVLYQKDMVTNMRHLVYVYGDILITVWSAEKVFQLLDRRPKVREAGDIVPPKLEGRLTFDNVTFSYPSRDALKSVSLELSPGKMTALVGPSGGGKSTCVSLLQRFYEPQEGEVLLDGVPIYRYEHQYLCSQMAAVSQNPELFSGSVSYNIAYGLQDCSEERVKEAAKKACAHDFINNMAEDYNTDVGQRGERLSSGQRQCIAIARAMIRNPKILILDEATSKLDSNTQHAVQTALSDSDSKGQTVLVVAHRLQTIEKADHIIYMEDGRIVEQGSHQQLMDKRGCYFELREKMFTLDTEQQN